MRGLGPLLRKEVAWSRHRVATLLLVLVLLPGATAAGAAVFQHVLPTDAPVGVVSGEDVTETDRQVLTAALDLFSKPVDYEDRSAALRALEREGVYAVVGVPPGISDPDVSRVNVTVTIDSDVVPYREPAGALAGVLSRTLNGNLDKRVVVSIEALGPPRTLPEYLLVTFLFGLVATFAFAYLPYLLASEERAIDRIRVSASLEAAVTAKLLFLTGLLLVPIGVFQAAAWHYGYDVRLVAPGALVAFAATFLGCGAVATAVTLRTRFSTAGRLLNVLLLFGVVGLSGVVYPAGFFSSIRREIVRAMPTHYAVVLARGAALKDHSLTQYPTWIAGLAGFVLASALVAKVAIVEYERHA